MSEELPPTDLRANVTAFHKAFGQYIGETPAVPAEDVARLRPRLIGEEFVEVLEAFFGKNRRDIEAIRDMIDVLVNHATLSVDMVELADGLADLHYVIEGTFLAFGIDSRGINAEVQRSNLAKVGGKRREDGKWTKPVGWTPPDIAGVLSSQGWPGDVTHFTVLPTVFSGSLSGWGVDENESKRTIDLANEMSGWSTCNR